MSNNHRNSHCYRETVYENIILQLSEFGQNSDYSRFVLCPKANCNERIYTRFYLYRHIESHHPEDILHNSIRYFTLVFCILLKTDFFISRVKKVSGSQNEPSLEANTLEPMDTNSEASEDSSDSEDSEDGEDDPSLFDIQPRSLVDSVIDDDYMKVRTSLYKLVHIFVHKCPRLYNNVVHTCTGVHTFCSI